MSAQYPRQYNELMAKILMSYGITLGNFNQISEAAAVEMQAISLLRNLAQTENEHTKSLCSALNNYGGSCTSLGRHAEAVLVFQECILLQRALAAANPEQESRPALALYNIVKPLRALGRHAEANDAVNERNQGRALEDRLDAPTFQIWLAPPKLSPLPFSLVKSSPPMPPLTQLRLPPMPPLPTLLPQMQHAQQPEMASEAFVLVQRPFPSHARLPTNHISKSSWISARLLQNTLDKLEISAH
jgi:hypothetical protein